MIRTCVKNDLPSFCDCEKALDDVAIQGRGTVIGMGTLDCHTAKWRLGMTKGKGENFCELILKAEGFLPPLKERLIAQDYKGRVPLLEICVSDRRQRTCHRA